MIPQTSFCIFSLSKVLALMKNVYFLQDPVPVRPPSPAPKIRPTFEHLIPLPLEVV